MVIGYSGKRKLSIRGNQIYNLRVRDEFHILRMRGKYNLDNKYVPKIDFTNGVYIGLNYRVGLVLGWFKLRVKK